MRTNGALATPIAAYTSMYCWNSFTIGPEQMALSACVAEELFMSES